MYPSIGKKIREYRKERGLTQDELAEKVNLSPNHMGAIERAEKNLTLATLINIANALDVTADMLLCDEIQNGYRIKTSMLTEKLEKLSPTDRNKILQMVDIMLGEQEKNGGAAHDGVAPPDSIRITSGRYGIAPYFRRGSCRRSP